MSSVFRLNHASLLPKEGLVIINCCFYNKVQIHVRLRCQPLPEEQFKSIIIDNYYSQNHFWFELDHAQTSKLMSLLSCRAIASSTVPPRNATQWRTLFQAPPSHDRKEEGDGIKPPAFEVEIPHSSKSNGSSSSDIATCPDSKIHPLENCLDKQVVEKEEDLIYMKLKELALSRERSDLPLSDVEDSAVTGQETLSEARTNLEEKNEESLVSSCDYPSIIAQVFGDDSILNF